MTDRNRNRSGYKKTKVGWIPESWEVQAIGHLGQVQGGRQRSPHYTQGKFYPYLRVANIMDGYIDLSDVLTMRFSNDEYERYRLLEKDILLNEGQSLELVGRSAIYEGKPANCCFQNTLIRFRPGPKITVDFAATLFSYLQKTWIFAKHSSQTTSIAHLGVKHFSSILTVLPTLPEQKKIAEILSTWDKAIEQARQLVEAKKKRRKGLMQQLLWEKKRLEGFNGKWRNVQIKDLFKRVIRKNSSGSENALTISGPLGLVSQKDYFNKRIAAEDLSSYFLLKKGEFAYNKSYCNGFPMGAIKMLELYPVGVVSTLYICFRLNDSSNDSPTFMKYYFESGKHNHQLYSIVQEGARNHGLLNVAPHDFFTTSLEIPQEDEQQAIAQVLQTAEQEINQLEIKLQALDKQKRGLMQKLLTGEIRVAT